MRIIEASLNSRASMIALLAVGFPQRTSSEWEKLFDRMDRTLSSKKQVINAPDGGPRIGWLLGDEQAPDGVLLGFPNPVAHSPSESADSKAPQHVNISSWYVKEERRSQAIWMLRKITSLPGHTFSDLTPSESVARMLPSLGFAAVTGGMLRCYTPQAILSSRHHWRVIDAKQMMARQTNAAMVQAFKDHLALDCLVVGLVYKDYCLPVVLKKSIRRHTIAAAEVIYLPAPQAGHPHPYTAIPSLARWLAMRGILLLEIEKSLDDPTPLPLLHKLVNDRPRFARGLRAAGAINHLYSEVAHT